MRNKMCVGLSSVYDLCVVPQRIDMIERKNRSRCDSEAVFMFYAVKNEYSSGELKFMVLKHALRRN